jgi:pyrroline-5-carboxylate reductase
MTTPHAIGFLGAGQMATALARGWAAAGLLDAAKSLASDPYLSAREKFTSATGVRSVTSNAEVAAAAPVLVLAVKPQTMAAALGEVRSALSDNHVVISIAAGVTLKQLAEHLGTDTRLVRVMPNTPCLVGASAAGIAAGPAATKADVALVDQLFNAVGKAYAVPESQLDAVTGLSGSGPAFVYVMIEALADGGVRAGLPRDVALALAAQTVLGSAKMVLETGSHPGVLKDAVASPGGTTIAGLHALERAGVRGGLMDAVEAAARRATELGEKK